MVMNSPVMATNASFAGGEENSKHAAVEKLQMPHPSGLQCKYLPRFTVHRYPCMNLGIRLLKLMGTPK